MKGAVAAGWEVDLVCSGYPGASAHDVIDGVGIHRHGHWTVANFVLPQVVKRLLRSGDYDLLVEDINKIPFFSPLFCGDTPLVAIVPHLFGTTVYREANPLVATYVYGAERLIPRVYKNVDFEVISPSTREDLIARGLDGSRIRTILCGLEHERFTLADPPPRSEIPLVVAWSRLRKYKSIDVAIRAFALIRQEVPAARMLIMGRGPDRERLQKLVTRLGLDPYIEFQGFLSWTELVQTLHRCHVFLNTSPKEGWGLTVVEANQCGLPVVASDRPGLKDSVSDGHTGSLVPFGDEAAFARQAVQLLQDHELWSRRSEAAREWAGTFSWPRCVEESLALFEEVALRRRQRRDP
ncbi:MAG: glycosyltransferase family 4 protein [Gemmatimonadales bacterium]|nr:glycosyltransferase family 4 protein [Gemmatimonadales bacterium]